MANSKSCATSVPARVGDENVPLATPLNVAAPSTRNGRFVGPPSAVTSGRHSSRLEVETETCSVEFTASVPEACTRDAGVDKLNCVSSSASLAPRYLPCRWAVTGSSRAATCAGGFTSSAKPTSAFCTILSTPRRRCRWPILSGENGRAGAPAHRGPRPFPRRKYLADEDARLRFARPAVSLFTPLHRRPSRGNDRHVFRALLRLARRGRRNAVQPVIDLGVAGDSPA